MSRITRRTLLKSAAAASAAFPLFTIAGTKASGRVIGANDTIRLGVAGINGRGTSHIDGFASQENVDVTYLIDPDSSLFESRSARVKSQGGNDPTCVQDIRRALEDKNLDAVSVATCNHWHSLITVWACQAGKDVYVEKPMSHNLFEGRKCVEAAAKYGRIVQHGTQQRSSGERAQQIAAIQSGKYGKLLVSKGYCCKPRWSIGQKPVEAAPSSLDFDLWLGPAPKQDFHRNLVHYNWHWFWDTGNGDTGNQGVHEMDVARWAIKGATLPNKVWSIGGRFFPEGPDQGETPNMQLSVYEYGDVLLVFETRGLVDNNKKYPKAPPFKVANEFYTTEGKIIGWKFYPKNGGDAESIQGEEASVAPGGPFGAFTAAVRSRRTEDVNCDAEVAHYSSALCHLGNISYRLGESAKFDEKAKSLGDNKQVVESFDALKDNLSSVDIKLGETTYSVGRTLNLDPKSEKFIGDDEANALLTRPYREPFVVPEQV
ncbi:MAG: Gfo/Idh/MocA family oxidoreductase [Planctomycetota bacterium]|nr:Gfo/Idh/MocA family oxidoreductase [Planctomycetota bacterium]